MFSNEKGDWKKAKELGKQFLIRCKVAQDLEKDRAENYNKMKELAVALYSSLPLYDSLLGDCPLFPTRIRFHLLAYSKRIGMDGIKNVFTPVTEIKDFMVMMEDAVKWALKGEKILENEKENEMVG